MPFRKQCTHARLSRLLLCPHFKQRPFEFRRCVSEPLLEKRRRKLVCSVLRAAGQSYQSILGGREEVRRTCTPSWQLLGPVRTIFGSISATASQGTVSVNDCLRTPVGITGLLWPLRIGLSSHLSEDRPCNIYASAGEEAVELTFSERFSR